MAVFNIIRNYGQGFSTFETTRKHFSILEEGFFFYLETERFLPITGDKSCKSDWN